MAIERTFVMVKPDGVQRGLIGRVIQRFEDKGLKIVALRMLHIDEKLAGRHYEEHTEKPFFQELVDFITSGPVAAMVLEGDNAIAQVRTLMGATDPQKSPPGSIRGDFGMILSKNIVHGSDKPESASREISLFFNDDQLMEYKRINEDWLY
jgi:nucleoside-diphosphate kinase